MQIADVSRNARLGVTALLTLFGAASSTPLRRSVQPPSESAAFCSLDVDLASLVAADADFKRARAQIDSIFAVSVSQGTSALAG